MARVVGVGFSCTDIYQGLDKFYPTGNGVDFWFHLACLGLSTSVVSVVGTDNYGSAMIDTLNHQGVDTSHLHVLDGDTCKMIMGMKDNDRIHLEEIEGVMANFSLSDNIEIVNIHPRDLFNF